MTDFLKKCITSVRGGHCDYSPWAAESIHTLLYYTTRLGKTRIKFRNLIGGPFRKKPCGKQEADANTRIRKWILRNRVARMWTWIILLKIESTENVFPFASSSDSLLLKALEP
jgi:hypothetical protein